MRLLLSYHYFKKADIAGIREQFATLRPDLVPEVFCDSGAFSAMTQGVTINVHEYGQWLRKGADQFSVYANLDVIKDARRTWRNQRILEEDYGLHPLPVFHVLEDWRYLAKYLERYQYIALGVAGSPSRVYMPWLVKCFRMQREINPRAVFHGFGITTWEALVAFPWYSVDSTSWNQGFKYGQVVMFNQQRGGFPQCTLGDHHSCYRQTKFLRGMGWAPDLFSTRAASRADLAGISMQAYLMAEQWLRRLHGRIPHPTDEGAEAGLKLYFADTSSRAKDAFIATEALVKRGYL